MRSLIQRFESKIYYSIDGCWYWTGSLNMWGYGMIGVSDKLKGAHRVSYELYKGKIPDGLFVLHSCDNRACVNPDHLRIGTQLDNLLEMQDKGRKAILRGIANPRHKLNEVQVREILSLKGKMKAIEIAKKYGLEHRTIYDIFSGRRWRHLSI